MEKNSKNTTSTDIKTKRVKQIRCHIGVQIRNQVLTSVDAQRHNVIMEILPMGVYVISDASECIVPYANIHSIDLFTN